MKPVYHPEFKASYDEALAWYGKLSAHLGERFGREIKSGVTRVLQGQVTDAFGPHGFRCHRCKKFPCLVYDEIDGDTALFLAVLYAGRDPGFLQAQLASDKNKRA